MKELRITLIELYREENIRQLRIIEKEILIYNFHSREDMLLVLEKYFPILWN